MIFIAVDGMGGDNAPEVVLKGMSFFHRRCPKICFLLFGDEGVIAPLLAKDPSLKKQTEFIHTPEAISVDMKPSYSLRHLRKSSMRLALEAVRDGKAHGAVSAGNTGAYLALSKTILKTIPGISRPAIARQVPTLTGESVMLDMGGSLSCGTRELIDFALMGSVFAQDILKIPNPSVGILNVGSERTKGHEELQEAAEILSSSHLNFFGFIEGNDVSSGRVHVIVTDGFTGNVALKAGEGVMKLMVASLKRSFSNSLFSRMAGLIARPVLKSLKQQFDPRIYNGALWLGLEGIAVKSHGGTDALGFAYALETTMDMIQGNIHCRISEEIQKNPIPCASEGQSNGSVSQPAC